MKKVSLLVVLLLLCLVVENVAQNAENDDLKIRENEFSKKAYRESLDYLRKEFPKILMESKDPQRAVQSSEVWIGFYNSLTFIEGYQLKQSALIEAKMNQYRKNKESSANREYQKFLKKAEYID